MTNGDNGAGGFGTSKITKESPFYISHTDKPGEIITDVRLKLNNFDDWAHAIRQALRAKRKFVFLDSTYKNLNRLAGRRIGKHYTICFVLG